SFEKERTKENFNDQIMWAVVLNRKGKNRGKSYRAGDGWDPSPAGYFSKTQCKSNKGADMIRPFVRFLMNCLNSH
ncbi:MAG: hypothetical protein RR426_06670, partial [Oscillospiraceae bacterium]